MIPKDTELTAYEVECAENLKTNFTVAACAGWLVILWILLSIVGMIDEHYSKKLDSIIKPVPMRTEK